MEGVSDVVVFEEPKFAEYSNTTMTYSYSICGRHDSLFFGTHSPYFPETGEWDDVSFIPVDPPATARNLYLFMTHEQHHLHSILRCQTYIDRCDIVGKGLLVIPRVTPLKLWLSEKKRSLADGLGRAPTAADSKHWWSFIEPEFKKLFRNVLVGLKELYEKGLVLGNVSNGIVITGGGGGGSKLIPKTGSGKTAGEEIQELRSLLMSVCLPFGGGIGLEDALWLPREVIDVFKRLDHVNNPLLENVDVAPEVVLAAAPYFWNHHERVIFAWEFTRVVPNANSVLNAEFDHVYGESWVDRIPPGQIFRRLFARYNQLEERYKSIMVFIRYIYWDFKKFWGEAHQFPVSIDDVEIERMVSTILPGMYHAAIDVVLRTRPSEAVVKKLFREILAF